MATRTLVKSPPELWAEISDAEALGRRLEAFGEIRITRAEPESTVAWEGDRARGTVSLEPAGWGTRVTVEAAVEAPARPSLWGRLRGRRPAEPVDADAVAASVLDDLGADSRRPFSR